MKTWYSPEIKELSLSGTAFGAGTGRVDYTFKDQFGNVFSCHSGTGQDSENRDDRVPRG